MIKPRLSHLAAGVMLAVCAGSVLADQKETPLEQWHMHPSPPSFSEGTAMYRKTSGALRVQASCWSTRT